MPLPRLRLQRPSAEPGAAYTERAPVRAARSHDRPGSANTMQRHEEVVAALNHLAADLRRAADVPRSRRLLDTARLDRARCTNAGWMSREPREER